jgi:acetyl esterase/lipase
MCTGGGWSGGDKGNVSFKPEFFVSEGYVFVSVNYRLTPQVDFPVHAQDVAHAIASAMDNIGQFGGDANQLYLMGHSAGAHLVTLVATDEGYLAEHGKSLSDLRGVISNDIRAYDMVDLAARSGGVLPSSYQPVFGEDPEFWAMASPISHVASDKGIPPMMILYSGTGNDSGRAYFANNFADALNVAGVKTRVVGSLGQTHSEINREIGTPNDQVTAAIMRFLDDISDT